MDWRIFPVVRRRWPWLVCGLVSAAVLASGGSWLHARWASSGIRSLAVLPLVDLGPYGNPGWYADGLTEEIIDAVAQLPGVQVTGRDSAFQFRTRTRDLRKVGEQLGVAAVVEGAMRNDAGKVRIALEMKRTADGYKLWSDSVERSPEEIYRLPDDVADAIASRIHLPGGAARPAIYKPSSPPVYEAFLEGRCDFHQTDAGSLTKAVDLFERATGLDSGFARAWAWLSMARERLVEEDLVRANESMPAARDAAERSVMLSADLGEAHAALGVVKLQYDWDWAGAKTELDRARELLAGSAMVLHWRARWYETQGRMEEAAAEMQHALTLDPLSGEILSDAAREYLAAGQADRALAAARKALTFYPDSPWVQVSVLNTIYAGGQRDQVRQIARVWHDSPPAPDFPLRAAEVAARDGAPDEANSLLDKADALRDARFIPADVFAGLAAATRDADALFQWLDLEYEERNPRLPYIRLNPDVPSSDARFGALLERMKLPVRNSGSR